MPDRLRNVYDLTYPEQIQLLTNVQTAAAAVVRDAGLAVPCMITVIFGDDVQAANPLIAVSGRQDYALCATGLKAAAEELLVQLEPSDPEPK
jgi:hypothetical protein